MCEFMSFLVHDRADNLPISKRYLFGDLRSHSGTAELHGVKYGTPDVWREAEWTGDDARSLVVRATGKDKQRELTAVILGDFATRDQAIAHALGRLPDSVTTLDLSGCTALSAVPDLPNVEYLDLSGCTALSAVPDLPNVKTLYLSGCTALLAVPDLPNVEYLDLSGCTALLAVPDLPNVKTLDLDGCTALSAVEFPKHIVVYR
jgi:hypothetical protein